MVLIYIVMLLLDRVMNEVLGLRLVLLRLIDIGGLVVLEGLVLLLVGVVLLLVEMVVVLSEVELKEVLLFWVMISEVEVVVKVMNNLDVKCMVVV